MRRPKSDFITHEMLADLTDLEVLVFNLYVDKYNTITEISRELRVTRNLIHYRVGLVHEKMGTRTRQELISKWARSLLLSKRKV